MVLPMHDNVIDSESPSDEKPKLQITDPLYEEAVCLPDTISTQRASNPYSPLMGFSHHVMRPCLLQPQIIRSDMIPMGNTAGLMEECAILADDDTTVTDWKLRIDSHYPNIVISGAKNSYWENFESSIHDVSFVINGSTRGCRQNDNASSSYLRHG